MLTDAWPIHCGPCIINVPEEFSDLKLSKKCDVVLILNDNKEEMHNNEQQHTLTHTYYYLLHHQQQQHVCTHR